MAIEVDQDLAPTDANANFGELLGFEYTELAPDRAVLSVPLRPALCNRFGGVHGGVIMSLLDTAGLWAGKAAQAPLPEAVTAALNCNFLRAARLADTTALRAEARVIKRGRSMYFSQIEVIAEPSGSVLASAQGVYGSTANSTPRA